jgi:hypothetical protein
MGLLARLPVGSSLVVALVSCGGSNGAQGGGSLAVDAAVADGGSTGDGSPSTGGTDGAGAASVDGGSGSAAACKRGIGANTAPTTAFAHTSSSPGISWWYDWSDAVPKGAAAVPGIAFVPMIWGSANLAGPIPAGSTYVLGFNEPNFKAQSNLTPQQAATDWPQVESMAKAAGIPMVSPAVNFCGSASDSSGCSDPTVTDPYSWLKDFFAACTGCEVDAVAVHWYNCDLPSLQGYIDGNASLEGFVQFGKPIWLTEFSCDGTHSVADQTAYMQQAVPYLEGNPNVARYAWFSATPIPNAVLENPDGSLTALGTTYASLQETCQ